MNPIDLLLLVFASWRLSYMLVEEEGPGNIFVTLRRKVGVTYDKYSQKQTEGWVGELFSCVWCMSVWVSFGLVYLSQWGFLRSAFIAPLAISGLVVAIHGYLQKP